MLNLKKHPFLIETLCAILMILPQGKTSNTLKNRIEISRLMLMDAYKAKPKGETIENGSGKLGVNIGKLMNEYIECQRKFQNGGD
jgi:hypothetical protein